MIENLFKHGIINLEYQTMNNYQAYMAFKGLANIGQTI